MERQFITDEQRRQLQEVYHLIQKVYKDLNIHHEEYSIIKNASYSLKSAIECKAKFY